MKRLLLSIVIAVLALLVVAGGIFAAQMNFRAHMRPGDIVPLPANVDSQAQGQAIFKLSDDGMSMSYKLNVANIDHVIMAHIHMYVGEGKNGPIIVWLYPSVTSTAPGAPTERIDGELADGVFGPADLRGGFTWDQLLDLMRSGQAYVNVHTSEAPAGEINGRVH